MKPRRPRISAMLVLFSALGFCPRASAQQPTFPINDAPDRPPGFSGNPRAIRMLRDLEYKVDIRELLYVDLVCTHTISNTNGDQHMTTATARLWRRQPDKLVWISSGARPWTVTCDGKKVISCLPDRAIYTSKAYDRTVLDSELFAFSSDYGVTLSHLMCRSLRGSQSVTFHRGEDLGREELLGTEVHHIRIGSGPGIVDVWLNDQELPVHIMETLQSAMENSTLIVSLKWKTDQPIPERSFSIGFPEDAMMVDALPQRNALSDDNSTSATGQ
ncbi:MAG: DUF2092 domain-containing protein [Candidatus Sumerlaeaceae bacterium]